MKGGYVDVYMYVCTNMLACFLKKFLGSAGHGVYKNWCLDALEGSFVLNLIMLGVPSR